MYNYLFEEKCFEKTLESHIKFNFELQKKVRELLSKLLDIEYEEIEVIYYEKRADKVKLKLEAKKKIEENYLFKVELEITYFNTTIISLTTYISRVIEVYLSGATPAEDLVFNSIQEFTKKYLYVDILSDLKLKYEELSKKIYENLEILLTFQNNNLIS